MWMRCGGKCALRLTEGVLALLAVTAAAVFVATAVQAYVHFASTGRWVLLAGSRAFPGGPVVVRHSGFPVGTERPAGRGSSKPAFRNSATA